MLVVAMISQMPEFHLVQYFLSEQEVENEYERLSNAETSGLLWLSRSTSFNSYGIRNSSTSQPYRRQIDDKDETPPRTPEITSNQDRE
jgi:hypothetical protein